MSKFAQREETVKWTPSAHDAKTLAEKLSTYKTREQYGRKQYPFEQYLEDRRVIRYGENGETIVVDPFSFHRQTEINSLREWIAEQDQESFFQANPEERVAFQERVQALRATVRSVFQNANLNS